MSHPRPSRHPDAANRHLEPVAPPGPHQLAVMIWVAVFPTLTVLNLALGDWLKTLSPLLRTFVLATVAVGWYLGVQVRWFHDRLGTTRPRAFLLALAVFLLAVVVDLAVALAIFGLPDAG